MIKQKRALLKRKLVGALRFKPSRSTDRHVFFHHRALGFYRCKNNVEQVCSGEATRPRTVPPCAPPPHNAPPTLVLTRGDLVGTIIVQEFKVPEGFPEVLRDFTREVLRDQPKDMNRYGQHVIFPCASALKQHCRTLTSLSLLAGYEYFMEKLKNPALPSVDGKKK